MSETQDKKFEEQPYNPTVRWVIPQRLDYMTFVGKDVLAIAQDIYIVFLNLKTFTELVYVANNDQAGDGVDVVAGHKSNIFAFAEKVKSARIFIVNYPSFTILAELKDLDVNRYKGLCLMENDLVAGFSGFPDYLMSVWSWRSRQKLLSIPTGVIRRSQIYMSSRSHMLICECWGEGLCVWEVVQCHRRCLVLRRAREGASAWEQAEPNMAAVCWAADGQLYALDDKARLYGVLSDGVGMVTSLEWSEDIRGSIKTHMCSFGHGILIYGPDNCLRLLKKADTKWKVTSTYKPLEEVLRLISNSFSDVAVMWTVSGLVYKLTELDDNIDVKLVTYKQRDVEKIQLLAPDFTHVAMMSKGGVLAIYEAETAQLIQLHQMDGKDVSMEASPVDPLLITFGEVGFNYGMALMTYTSETMELETVNKACLTHQIVSRVVFSPTGRHVLAAAMSAGHVFIYELSESYELTLVRYAELGRGLADCCFMRVGDAMRCFLLVLFSDKLLIGERIVCINAETGKDNKFAGKMQGPYSRLMPLATKDTMLAIPYLSTSYHVLKLSGDKGVTVAVKMGPIIYTGHDIKQFDGFLNSGALLTYSFDGTAVLRAPDALQEYELKLSLSHRYSDGIHQAVVCPRARTLVHVSHARCVACTVLRARAQDVVHTAPTEELFSDDERLTIIAFVDKNYLDLQEKKKVKEEAMDYKKQRDEVVKSFLSIQQQLVSLLEENMAEQPLHQLSLAEFNLHLEAKKERQKQAEKEREEIRLATEARIVAQDHVTLWIKSHCWDAMLTPRVKLLAIFSHYQVENYPVLPSQRDSWPELRLTEALRKIEQQRDEGLMRPWEEPQDTSQLLPEISRITDFSSISVKSTRSNRSAKSSLRIESKEEDEGEAEPHVLSGTNVHKFVQVPTFMIPQTMAFSYLQMNWMHHIAKLNVQNMRLWFNKEFDDLMSQKKREVALVKERNARLRFIVEELNKLSDLRGSFHHLVISIKDPEWKQEEEPHKLIKVEPEECSIEPYISPSQVVIPPPEPRPKDDFKERALVDMMDGVLQKLWHEEITKPVPLPQCMLDKDPEHFNEEDLRFVFDYEAKVAFRNEERDKYRKMLHAEYDKLSQLLNEGIVKFNHKVKEMWLTKLRVDSVMGQESLNLMRLRRTNLDRLEMAEDIEQMRSLIAKMESEIEHLTKELAIIHEQSAHCQQAYDNLTLKDKQLEKSFRNQFADLSPVIVDQAWKFYKKRPKWHIRGAVTPATLLELASAVLSGQRPVLMPQDCLEYFKGLEQLDHLSNMPAVLDEALWGAVCRHRRAKVDNEIRMRAIVVDTGYVESAGGVWGRALAARRRVLANTHQRLQDARQCALRQALNKTIQLVLPAGQVEITTSGHMEDFEDATLLPRDEIEKINELILKVGELKLRMMDKQMEFRKGILSKEWEHAQMKMKLRHMEQELYSYQRLKIPKELQLYLTNKEKGWPDEREYVRLERELQASRRGVDKLLSALLSRVEQIELKQAQLESQVHQLDQLSVSLNVKVSEKRLNEDPLEPIRRRRLLKKRMETLVTRSKLIREVQANHTTIVMLQTQLELLRLKTYPTLASFRTIS